MPQNPEIRPITLHLPESVYHFYECRAVMEGRDGYKIKESLEWFLTQAHKKYLGLDYEGGMG